ncbi:hypothetical protein C7974DRAFT_305167 [Boeremia exigua]|uniref:uncharacterized protein n=1 Tax=Boeremia exigua TaxID=749465 RepID=UPI001E8E644E|nr:uncharacterized protein C7974DRAFT_305167 [Boeremia exigua]KAH6638866.1 hypothetical protein C7974DRAFT_305167 [Boeremia exigua]
MPQPSFVFRLSEICDLHPTVDLNNHWAPSYGLGSNAILPGGASSTWWLCNGRQIRPRTDANLPGGLKHYSTFSIYFSDGRGFLVMRGDATSATDETWFPLCFEHDQLDGWSSYLTNAREQPALLCRREDQAWVKMLLPDIYHGGPPTTGDQAYGALKGELAIFLALIAFAIPRDQVQIYLPAMLQNGTWQQYNMVNGRVHGRGVMVEVFTYSRAGGSPSRDLRQYENGRTGKYYT